MNVEYTPGSQLAYVLFRDEPVGYTRMIDDDRLLDYTTTGDIIGLELLGVLGGVRLADLPVNRAAVARALRAVGIPVLDEPEMSSSLSRPGVVTVGVAHPGEFTPVGGTLVYSEDRVEKAWAARVERVTPHGGITLPAEKAIAI